MADADTKEEFVKSYNGGWFGLKVGDKVAPCCIAEKNSPAGPLILKYIVDAKGKTLSKELDWVTGRADIERGYPDLGCVKVGPTVGFLSVRPLRQFKKGYVSENVHMHVPNHSQIKRAFPRFTATSGTKDVVWQVFNREYWSVAAALKELDEGGGVGYPLSTNFGIYSHSDHPNPIVLMRTHDAGVYKDGKIQLFKNFGIFKEQFKRETKVEATVCA